jgi:pSer/pThr/pTyr-binding forkhead associated (FHA) protein
MPGAQMSQEAGRRPGAADAPNPASAERPESGFRRRVATKIVLRYSGSDLVLGRSEVVIGRGVDADVVLSSALVSRRHARLSIDDEGAVTIEDLSSRNGVYVNGELLRAPRRLEIGDRLDIGGEELELAREVDEEAMRRRDTQLEMRAQKPLDAEERTRQASAFVLLGGLLDKLLALGRVEEAERLMSTHLERLLADAEKGARPESFATAGHYAVRLAEATGKARWVDYGVRLYLALREPMPAPQIDALHAVVRRVQGVDIVRLREYVGVLRARASELGPAERFALRRIESLADVAAL